MRCKNCGWPNKPESTTCAKCGAALDSTDPGVSEGDLKKTVLEKEVFGMNAAQPIWIYYR